MAPKRQAAYFPSNLDSAEAIAASRAGFVFMRQRRDQRESSVQASVVDSTATLNASEPATKALEIEKTLEKESTPPIPSPLSLPTRNVADPFDFSLFRDGLNRLKPKYSVQTSGATSSTILPTSDELSQPGKLESTQPQETGKDVFDTVEPLTMISAPVQATSHAKADSSEDDLIKFSSDESSPPSKWAVSAAENELPKTFDPEAAPFVPCPYETTSSAAMDVSEKVQSSCIIPSPHDTPKTLHPVLETSEIDDGPPSAAVNEPEGFPKTDPVHQNIFGLPQDTTHRLQAKPQSSDYDHITIKETKPCQQETLDRKSPERELKRLQWSASVLVPASPHQSEETKSSSAKEVDPALPCITPASPPATTGDANMFVTENLASSSTVEYDDTPERVIQQKNIDAKNTSDISKKDVRNSSSSTIKTDEGQEFSDALEKLTSSPKKENMKHEKIFGEAFSKQSYSFLPATWNFSNASSMTFGQASDRSTRTEANNSHSPKRLKVFESRSDGHNLGNEPKPSPNEKLLAKSLPLMPNLASTVPPIQPFSPKPSLNNPSTPLKKSFVNSVFPAVTYVQQLPKKTFQPDSSPGDSSTATSGEITKFPSDISPVISPTPTLSAARTRPILGKSYGTPKATSPAMSAQDIRKLEEISYLAAWPAQQTRDHPPPRPRRVKLSNLSSTYNLRNVAALVFGGVLQEIQYVRGTSSALVTFVDPDACSKYFAATSNGIEVPGENPRLVYVDLDPQLMPIPAETLLGKDHGITRVVKVIMGQADDPLISDLTSRARGEKNERQVEHITYKESTNIVEFRMASIKAAIHLASSLRRDPDWEHCNVRYGKDPCELATDIRTDVFS